jgi:hypothetical protein
MPSHSHVLLAGYPVGLGLIRGRIEPLLPGRPLLGRIAAPEICSTAADVERALQGAMAQASRLLVMCLYYFVAGWDAFACRQQYAAPPCKLQLLCKLEHVPLVRAERPACCRLLALQYQEGCMIKQLGSAWEPGDRSGTWCKLKPDYLYRVGGGHTLCHSAALKGPCGHLQQVAVSSMS